MKRHFMMGLKALCTGVMTLCVASLSFTSCYDDSALNAEVDELGDKVTALDARLQAVEALTAKLEALTARVDALYTLKFQVTATNELQYSFDGGTTWVNTGIKLAKELECTCEPAQPCTCVDVTLVDNGDSVTITVGEQSFTIEKPEEIVFEIRAGKLYFESEGTVAVAIKSSGIEDISVMSAPKGWFADINADGQLEITAPNFEETQPVIDYDTWTETPGKYAASGYVKVHACSAAGKCMVGKLPVEVVSQALSVKAYGGNAYFTVATTYEWGPTYFYGAATKETLEAETSELIAMMSSGGWDHYDVFANTDETEFTVSIEELLGEEPQLGQEYVIWAIVEKEDYGATYSAEDLIITYYSPLEVTLKEVEAEKSAYNVTVNVEVVGADSYVAVAMPELYCDDPEYSKEQMIMALAEGQYYGKLYTESYTGSALDIAAGTTFSMTGNYSPASDVYVFVLPLDGRPAEDYTVEDVVMAVYTTANLTAGGKVDLTVKQVEKYMGKVYDYEIWDYVEKEIVVDQYSQLCVEVARPSSDDWSALYFLWLDETAYAECGVSDEATVAYLLENAYPNAPSDVEAWPLYITETTSPKTTMHFVAFVVDNAGYGKVAHLEATTKELARADLEWDDAKIVTNLEKGTLKNSTTLRFTPAFVDGKEAASYKYVLAETKYNNQYAGMNDAQMAEELFFSTSDEVKTVSAEELLNGVLYVDGHKYGNPYYFAIVALDETGAPAEYAYVLEYETVLALDDVVTEGTEFETTRPTIKINLPTDDQFVPDGGWLDGAYYTYQDQTEWDYGYYITVELNYEITPAEGTEVSAVIFDATTYKPADTPAAKAGQVWSESLGFSHLTTTEYVEASFKQCNWYLGETVPAHYIYVSWKDADGNTYFEEYDVTNDLKHYDSLVDAMINGESGDDEPSELPTPEGKQWAFDWTTYAGMMGMEHMSACLDFGVSQAGFFMAGIDYEAIYGPEAAGMWMAGVEGAFEVEATDATSGVIRIMKTDFVTGESSFDGTTIEYSDLTETTCTFNGTGQFEELIVNVQATLMEEVVVVQSQGIGGM